jgi:[acyl-carrier-protein] S-malonyltransferase
MSALLGIEANDLLEIISQVDGFVDIANYNTYGQLVISGEEDAVLKVNELALSSGAKRAILLNTSGPFHTKLMKEASDKLEQYIKAIEFKEPKYHLLVNTTGTYYETNIKKEMSEQITSSVQFYQMVEQCLKDGIDTFIEIGPKKTLLGLVKKIDKSITMLNIEDVDSLMSTIKKLEE